MCKERSPTSDERAGDRLGAVVNGVEGKPKGVEHDSNAVKINANSVEAGADGPDGSVWRERSLHVSVETVEPKSPPWRELVPDPDSETDRVGRWRYWHRSSVQAPPSKRPLRNPSCALYKKLSF